MPYLSEYINQIECVSINRNYYPAGLSFQHVVKRGWPISSRCILENFLTILVIRSKKLNTADIYAQTDMTVYLCTYLTRQETSCLCMRPSFWKSNISNSSSNFLSGEPEMFQRHQFSTAWVPIIQYKVAG